MSLKETVFFDEWTGDIVAKRVVAIEDTVRDGDGAIVDKDWASVEDANEDVVVSGVTKI